MPRLRMTIAYVGTAYKGWQIQKNGETIQGVLEKCLARICQTHIRVHGSGRTDSGVHAVGQVAHCDVPEDKSHIPWQRALNAMLPPDISVLDVTAVPESFHARFSVLTKRYAYTLWTNPAFTLPQRAPYVWAVRRLDFEAMDRAALLLCGTHDFSAFQNAGTEVKGTVRTLFSVTRTRGTLPDEWMYTFHADGFLKQMVRNLMGLLVEVGRGSLTPQDGQRILAGCDRTAAPATAPPQGLSLEFVEYPPLSES